MKLKNHDYILFSNIVITGILQISYFNLIGLISVILSILYLLILLFLKLNLKTLNILFVFSIITGMIYYLLNPLYESNNINMTSVLPAIFLILGIIFGIKMPIIKRNNFFGVKTPLALKNDEVWKKVNNVGSILFYMMLFPLYILIFYFDNSAKEILSIITLLFFSFLTLGIALYIESKYKCEMNRQEKIDIEKQTKKENGW